MRARILITVMLALLLLMTWATTVGAVPPLPFTVYGRVQINGENALVGTEVKAYVDGSLQATTTVTTYQGTPVFVLDIPGSAYWVPSSGGPPEAGKTVTFTVAGAVAGQTTTWTMGGSQVLTLTVSGLTQLSLSTGWNLVSIPIVPSSTTFNDVLASIVGEYDLVYSYIASDPTDPWKKYNTAAPPFLNDLTEINERMGFWIRTSGAKPLTVSGVAPLSPTIPLVTGWNLVGYPSQVTRPITEALASIAGKYDLVYTYDASDMADPWKKYNVAAPPFLNDLVVMSPRRGYWIRVTQDCTWKP